MSGNTQLDTNVPEEVWNCYKDKIKERKSWACVVFWVQLEADTQTHTTTDEKTDTDKCEAEAMSRLA